MVDWTLRAMDVLKSDAIIDVEKVAFEDTRPDNQTVCVYEEDKKHGVTVSLEDFETLEEISI